MLDLVIQHGLLGGPRNWSSITRAIQPHVGEINSPWLRNHGAGVRSPQMTLSHLSEDLSDLLSSQSRPFILLGSSYGGFTIMRYLVTRQECLSPHFRGAFVVDVAPSPFRPSTMPNLYKELPAVMELPLTTPGYSLKQAMADLEEAIPSADQRGFLLSTIDFSSRNPHPVWNTDVEVIHKNLKNLDWDLSETEVFDKCSVPIKFVFGENSPYFTDEEAQRSVKQVFPGATVEVIEKAGHWVHVQQRERFLQSLIGFCGECEKE